MPNSHNSKTFEELIIKMYIYDDIDAGIWKLIQKEIVIFWNSLFSNLNSSINSFSSNINTPVLLIPFYGSQVVKPVNVND